jgi:signal transduction histidine kinase
MRATLRALAQPRRAWPLAGVLVALVGSELVATGEPRGLVVDAALFASFCLLAPTTYRWAAAVARATPQRATLAYATFVATGLAVVGGAMGALAVMRLPGTYVMDPPAFGLLVVLFLVGGWGLGRDIDLELGLESAERRAERMALEAERARLLAMRSQLDPHFLFNVLNAIAEWCREEPRLAEEATLKLSAMLRAMLEGIESSAWPLEKELALVRMLAGLYAVRDRERFVFAIDEAPAPDVDVPPLLLLPLIENAITHGPAAGHRGEVRVRWQAEGARVVVTIENPGEYAGRREGGRGVSMVERRLALAYGDRASLAIEARGAATVASVTIPRG